MPEPLRPDATTGPAARSLASADVTANLPHSVPAEVLRSLCGQDVFADIPAWKAHLLIAKAWNAAVDHLTGALSSTPSTPPAPASARHQALARKHAEECAEMAAAHAAQRAQFDAENGPTWQR